MRTRAHLLLLAVLVAAVTACTAGDGDDTAEIDHDAGVTAEADGTTGGGEEGAPMAAATDTATAGDVGVATATAGRKVVREVDVTLASDDPEATVAAVTTAAERAGGFVAASDLHRREGVLRGSLTLRVPADDLATTLDAIEAAGAEVVARVMSSDDVTGEYVDVAAQLRNLRALETELLALLAEARDEDGTEQVLTVFERIRGVRDEIERLQGRQELLDDLVALATVRVEITPTPTLLARGESPVAPAAWSPARQAGDAWDATVQVLQRVGDVAIWAVVTVLPVVLVVGLPVAAVWTALRRGRRRWAAR